LRSRRRAPVMDCTDSEDLIVSDLSPERHCSGEQLFAAMQRALDELPAKCREIFLLHRMEGLSRDEIATRLGLGERMVRLYMARALEHLQRRLHEVSEGKGTAS
jgi:RNA polymerase sigma factor (sigma-70 family)